MALRNATSTPANTKPAFESEDDGDTAVAERPAPAAERPAPAAERPAPAPAAAAPAAAPAPASTTAVVPAAPRSLATQINSDAAKFADEVAGMRGAADFTYGNYTVFKGNNGEIISTGDNPIKLGRWVKVSMFAWDEHFEVSPNEDSTEAREVVAYSKDGEKIDRTIGKELAIWAGRSVNDYLEKLRADGYDKASVRRFVDVGCVVLESENDVDMAGEVVQITLAPSSIKSFSSYQETLAAKAKAIARGIPGVKVPEDPFTFYFLREVAAANGKNWTKLSVVSKLPTRI